MKPTTPGTTPPPTVVPGIGEYIARALAARHMNLLLVARTEPELTRLAEELGAGDVKVAVAAIDLSHPRSYKIKTAPEFVRLKERLVEEIRAEALKVAVDA